jgi:hypothetical protein
MGYVSLINYGVEMYKGDFADYPPSIKGDNDLLPDWKGAQLLTLLLTGYGEDAENDGIPSGTLNEDDANSGFGFKLAQKGEVWGPYLATEELPIGTLDGIKVFVDEFDNPILYYRYDAEEEKYQDAHNSGGPPDINEYAKSDDKYRRRDFLLAAKGPDGWWRTEPGAMTDDVTNLEE